MQFSRVLAITLLTAWISIAHASVTTSCPDLPHEIATLIGARAQWPNFKDPQKRSKIIETLGLEKFAPSEDPLQTMLDSLNGKQWQHFEVKGEGEFETF